MNAETPVQMPASLAGDQPAPYRRQGEWRGGLHAAYASSTGSSHARNEDCCSHVPSGDKPAFVGVADGVGGGAHGEIASSVLLNHCAQAPREIWSDPARLVDWVGRADVEVRKAIAKRTDQAGAATLAAAWFTSPGTANVLNVGDCRVYQLRPVKDTYGIQRLTVDQTYASLSQEPPPNGNPEDPARMVGAGAVGAPPVVKAQLRERELLLLCSDGVHKFVPDAQMAAVVARGLRDRHSLETICEAIVAAAKANGSQDDASALLVMRRPWLMARWIYGCAVVALLLLSLFAGAQIAFAETQSVIDPTEAPEAPPLPAPNSARSPKSGQADSAARAERREAQEQRRKARAAARANEQAKKEAESRLAAARAIAVREAAIAAKEAAAREAAREASRRAAAKAARVAATRAAAAKATSARIVAQKEAAEREEAAKEAAHREAARELAAREAAREAAAKEAAIKEAAAREAAAREAAIKEANAREAAEREAAAKAARQAAAREAAANQSAKLLSSRRTRSYGSSPKIGTVFRDCTDCPELVWLPQGESIVGDGPDRVASDPRATAIIDYMLAVGRFEVTFAEWDACVTAGGCRRTRDSGWGRGRQPVIDVSWEDAQQYTTWLSRRTGKNYRLLTEAEWEYAARAGTDARYWWGDEAKAGVANCNDCGTRWDGRRTAPVGSFAPNPFGLYDMHGNVWEWVADCSHSCVSPDAHIIRGGAWQAPARAMRSAARAAVTPGFHDNRIGFRVARSD